MELIDQVLVGAMFIDIAPYLEDTLCPTEQGVIRLIPPDGFIIP